MLLSIILYAQVVSNKYANCKNNGFVVSVNEARVELRKVRF